MLDKIEHNQRSIRFANLFGVNHSAIILPYRSFHILLTTATENGVERREERRAQ
ncbi:hypothetical protein [Sphingomonas prati]|uniref:hypothetical protein n=1 Tax=Sphingomonas prati TaxID=1843237 RepID=UPI0018E0389E|nr:hypothetical protein [Sphingomonas prati]